MTSTIKDQKTGVLKNYRSRADAGRDMVWTVHILKLHDERETLHRYEARYKQITKQLAWIESQRKCRKDPP